MVSTFLVCRDAAETVDINLAQYPMEKLIAASDPKTLEIFTNNRNSRLIKQAFIAIGQWKPQVFDSTNPNSISCSYLTQMIRDALNNDLKFRQGFKYIAGKSVILSDKNMISLYNSFVCELQYNPKIQAVYLVDYYLHQWKVNILNPTPFITFEQYPYNLQGVVHYTIAEKAAYLSYCIDNGQYLVNPRGDQNDINLDVLLNRDRENFFSYMRILDRTHTL